MFTIRDLCKASNLSRSTILYYDSLGLLKPVERSASNYRLYSDKSLKIIKKICLYRDAGMCLEDISALLNMPEGDDTRITILENTLSSINKHIQKLQKNQKKIVDMLKELKGQNIIDNELFEQQMDERREQMRRDAYDIQKYLYGDEKE